MTNLRNDWAAMDQQCVQLTHKVMSTRVGAHTVVISDLRLTGVAEEGHAE